MCFFASGAFAQTNVQLTVDECVRIGLERNGMVHVARAEAAEALSSYRQIRSQRLPAINGQASYFRLSSNIPEIEVDLPPLPGIDPETFTIAPVELNRYYTQLSVEQPLFTGFRLHNTIRAAAHQAEAAEYAVESEEADLAFRIRQAYWNLYRALSLEEVIDQALAAVEAHLQDVRNRYEVGAALQSDILTVQTRRSEILLERVEVDNAVKLAQLELNYLTGIPLDSPVQPVSQIEVEPLPAEVETLVQRALETKPELLALSEQIDALDNQVDAAQGTWWPDVALVGRYVYARPNQYFFTEQDQFKGTWEAGITATWTIWNWGERLAQTNEARARLEAARARMDYARSGVTVTVNRQYLEVQRTLQAIEVTEQSVQEAEEAFRILNDRYQTGSALSAELLDAELALRQAQSQRSAALADYAVARAGLLNALGQIW